MQALDEEVRNLIIGIRQCSLGNKVKHAYNKNSKRIMQLKLSFEQKEYFIFSQLLVNFLPSHGRKTFYFFGSKSLNLNN